jgi:hypothetical protein
MSLFGSKKAEYEYVHACIEVTGFEIGDFEVDSFSRFALNPKAVSQVDA